MVVIWHQQQAIQEYGQAKPNGEESWRAKRLIAANDEVMDICWSSSGDQIVVGTFKALILVFNVDSGRMVQRIDGHQQQVQGVCWDPLGQWIASTGADAALRISTPGTRAKSHWHCAHAVTHLTLHNEAQDKDIRQKIFLGERVFKHFFRRLETSPCGGLLVVPAAQRAKTSLDEHGAHGTAVFHRGDLSAPVGFFTCPDGMSTTVRFIPYAFKPRKKKDLWFKYVFLTFLFVKAMFRHRSMFRFKILCGVENYSCFAKVHGWAPMGVCDCHSP